MTPKEAVLAIFERGESCFVVFFPRCAGVRVPAEHRGRPNLTLQFGLNLFVPIPDLEVDDLGIRGTLTFSRVPHYCDVPWTSALAVADERATPIWIRGEPAPEPELSAGEEFRALLGKPKLSLIKGGKA